MKYLLSFVAVFSAASAHAETLAFETDDTVLVLRGKESFGLTTYEFIGAPGAMYQCVALAADGQPIAATVALSDMAEIIFEDLPLAQVSDVKCRGI